jgi:hypothetical protein
MRLLTVLGFPDDDALGGYVTAMAAHAGRRAG